MATVPINIEQVPEKDPPILLQPSDDRSSQANLRSESFIQKPHTVLLLALCGILLYYTVSPHQSEQTTQQNQKERNQKDGLFFVSLCFLFFASLHLKEGAFRYPHPSVWRIAQAIALIYLLGLIFLLFQVILLLSNFTDVFFQDLDDARLCLTWLDKSLQVPVVERVYAEDCRILTLEKENLFDNIENAFFDRFVLAHIGGWLVKVTISSKIAIH